MGEKWVAPDGRPARGARWMRATWRNLPAGPYRVGCEAGLAVPGADGDPLLTDHYFPRAAGEPAGEDFPTLLVRSPYGRGVPWAPLYGILFAEQGFHVVVQSCRGTGGSGGAFHFWRNEEADGHAAVAWLRQQPWFNGALGTIGASYQGYLQWLLAQDPPPELRAMVVQVGLHDPYAYFHGGGALHLENALVSGTGMAHQHRGNGDFLRAALRLRRWLRRADRLPARGGTRPGEPYATDGPAGELPWLAELLTLTDGADPYWRGAAAEVAAGRRTVPTCLVGGWQDVFADQTIEQYRRLRAAGGRTALLIGPWTHASAFRQGWPEVFAESLAWLRAQLCGERAGLRPSPVRVHVGAAGGAGAWRELADWPPAPGGAAGRWYPTAEHGLGRRAPGGAAPVGEFRHDPADPTPSVGGPLLTPGAGRRDNRALEARADVLTFTGPALAEPLEVLGPVAARLRVTADGAPDGRSFDLFARLCEVDARGRSVNVCDGLVRVRGGAVEPREAVVSMGSAAHRFAAGHRMRLQISGGAFPRFAPPTAAPDGGTAPVRVVLHPGSALELP
ncbi:CocE/NonD family hydrolase [Streptomyces sp. NPDC057555]|uniref:CocE/NonD family hydrolase n=1 Tax=Streptomyces sp. NPDC057555 TaxID=3346166 RepID=UPI00367A6102